MGTDDLFRKAKSSREKRNKELRTPKANSFLIVTEGICTERNYFIGLRELLINKIGGNVQVISPEVEVIGKGMPTMKLIEAATREVKKAKMPYQEVWVVFDKDDFSDFDEAIKEGEKRGYKMAWTNQSFEYWIFLHFNYSDTALHRDNWVRKLNDLFKERGICKGKYQKNNKDIFNVLNEFDGPTIAIGHAKRRMTNWDSNESKPSEYDPGTTVHMLTEALLKYLKD